MLVGIVAFSNACWMFVGVFSEIYLGYSFECYVYPLFLVVRGGQGYLWLVKRCQFDR